MPSERRWAMDGPSARAVGQEGEGQSPRVPWGEAASNASPLAREFGLTPPDRECPNTQRHSNLRFDNAGGLWVPSP